MPPPLLFDPSTLDLNVVIADQEAIRQINPQRYEMEHLNAVVHVDHEQQLVVGYKDVRADEFWVRGHLPDYPLLPGVLMCEAVAQLCSYYVRRYGVIEAEFIGFGGLENVRFRNQVRPGERLVLVARATKLHRKSVIFACQAFVGSTMVFHGDVNGVALPRRPSPSASAEA
jgi:3-hydroxyacyl-[acyl-carrier-protein] dehydratase